MSQKLSVTAACTLANAYISRPVKFGQHSWQVFYREPGETASRTMQADSYSKALKMMVETEALIAVKLLGVSWGYQWNDGPDVCVYTSVCDGMDWQKAVALAHKQAITQ